MINKMNELKERINILIGKLKLLIAIQNISTPQGQKIFETAKKCLGIDASPNDVAPDELGCADTVSNILIKAGFTMPVIISTAKLYDYLNTQNTWVKLDTPLMGDVVVSPTGMGGLNGIKHGHTGIVGTGNVIMSNSSATGTFEPNYTISSWIQKYKVKGGYPIFYFRRML